MRYPIAPHGQTSVAGLGPAVFRLGGGYLIRLDDTDDTASQPDVPDRTRTCSPRFRRPMRYPVAPQGHIPYTLYGTFRMGLGPTASAVGVRCAIQLRYRNTAAPGVEPDAPGSKPGGLPQPMCRYTAPAGFEPTSCGSEPHVLTTTPRGKLNGGTRTHGLQGHNLVFYPTELHSTYTFSGKSVRLESNQGPPPYQGDALTICATHGKQGQEGSNLHRRFWRPLCCHCTIPPKGTP